MGAPQPHRVSGHVFSVRRQRGVQWYAKFRLPDGRQVQRRLGPAWTGRGRPPAGNYTKATAKAALESILTDARRGTLTGFAAKSGATFRDAAENWFEHGGAPRPLGRGWKPSTRRDYRSLLDVWLLPAFGDLKLEEVTRGSIERWLIAKTTLKQKNTTSKPLPPRTAAKVLTLLNSILGRAADIYGLQTNPAARIERRGPKYDAGRFDFYSVEEVYTLVRAAEDEPNVEKKPAAKQDAAICLTAALSGLRLGELLALRVRDVDFAAETIRVLGSVDAIEGVGTPKSGHGRAVPLVPQLAPTLARLLEREGFTGPDDFLFVNETGGHLDGSALRRRYKTARDAAKLPPLRFHDLRHTFGSLAINAGTTVDVQHWLGHADARTTMRYLHYRQRSDEAQRLGRAFEPEVPEPQLARAEKTPPVD